jgi:N-acetylmuramoyl-L-alanine amidase
MYMVNKNKYSKSIFMNKPILLTKYMKFYIKLYLIILAFMPTFALAAGKGLHKIVIDAGHGGSDAGAGGKFSHEKDLTLAISLRLGALIEKNLKNVEVIYTRTTDIYPSLKERHRIANQANADLFVSIHINSSRGSTERIFEGYKTIKKKKKRVQVPIYRVIHHHETTASGTEVQILGLHRAGQKASAMTSNTDNVEEEVGMLDVNDPQTAIIIAQYLQAFQGNSVLLGTYIQQEFSSQGRTDRGVKQMGLEVLAGSAMPGVLVECGFINNPSEEEYMNSEVGLDEIARAIFNGVRAYKAEIEKN